MTTFGYIVLITGLKLADVNRSYIELDKLT